MSRIWNSYSVLYVSKAVSEEKVLSVLESNSVNGTISLSKQKIPFASQVTPIEPPSSKIYLNSRISYFFDSSHDFQLYYIPQNQMAHTSRAVKQLIKETKAEAGLDGRERYPFTVPLVTLIVYVLLAIFAKNHLVILFPGFFTLLLSFSQPFYPVGSGSVLFLLALFFAQRLWGRRKAISVLLKNGYIIALVATGLIVCTLSSWMALVLILITAVCALSSLIILHDIETERDKKNSFTFCNIFPATHISVVYASNVKMLMYVGIPLVLLTVLFLFSARFTPSAGNTKLSLPSPTQGEGNLPVLEDYEKWVWDVETFPYRSLNKKTSTTKEEEAELKVTRYVSSSTGILSSTETVMRFDEDFINRVDEQIDKLSYPAVEQLMKKQGRQIQVSYSELGGGSQQTDGVSLFLMLLGLCVPFLLCSYYFIFGRGRYEKRK